MAILCEIVDSLWNCK